MGKNTQITWINCAKLVAILAVLTDHTNGILYKNQDIAFASYFSVSLFIVLSGMTSYFSASKRNNSVGKGLVKGCKKIVTAYCIAVAVYMIAMQHGFDLYQYLYYLVHFNISGPHYFVLLYIQLMAANGFLYNLLEKCPCSVKGYFGEGVMMAGIMMFASWTTNYTNILEVYGGGGEAFWWNVSDPVLFRYADRKASLAGSYNCW